MKKNKNNNNTSNTTKNVTVRQLKKQNKEQHAKEKEQRAKERIAAKEARKQHNEHKAVTVNAKPIKKALKSTGGVSITILLSNVTCCAKNEKSYTNNGELLR